MVHLVALDLHLLPIFGSWYIVEDCARLDEVLQGVCHYGWIDTKNL